MEDLTPTLTTEMEKVAEEKKPKKPAKKRAAHDIREEMVQLGAVFFEFRESKALSNQKWLNEWKAIQKYGFLVATTGCILPYKYFWKSVSAGDGLQGHKRAAHFFFNREPDRTERVNQYGWPCDEQISHLCHNPDCINPLHLTIELKWQNWKRTYCGFNGTCDCGMTPPCVRTYTNPETFHQQFTVESELSKVRTILTALNDKYPFKLFSKDKYRAEDEKGKNRQKRKKLEDKHKKQAAVNLEKKQKAVKPSKKVKKEASKDEKTE